MHLICFFVTREWSEFFVHTWHVRIQWHYQTGVLSTFLQLRSKGHACENRLRSLAAESYMDTRLAPPILCNLSLTRLASFTFRPYSITSSLSPCAQTSRSVDHQKGESIKGTSLFFIQAKTAQSVVRVGSENNKEGICKTRKGWKQRSVPLKTIREPLIVINTIINILVCSFLSMNIWRTNLYKLAVSLRASRLFKYAKWKGGHPIFTNPHYRTYFGTTRALSSHSRTDASDSNGCR